MKFIVTMKDPDGVYESLRQAARMKMINEHANKNPKWNVPDSGTVAFADLENEIDEALAELIEAVKPWFEYGEYLRVEIDTEAKTIKVLPVKD